jgi:hypothetical protein
VLTAVREDFFPRKPLIAAPARGNTGISQRLRLEVIV